VRRTTSSSPADELVSAGNRPFAPRMYVAGLLSSPAEKAARPAPRPALPPLWPRQYVGADAGIAGLPMQNVADLPQYGNRHIAYKLLEKNTVRTKSHTYEVQIPGMKMYVTMDPENVKAILATQFQDFGKGPLFYESWKEVWTSACNPLIVSSSVMGSLPSTEQDGQNVERCCDPNSSNNGFPTSTRSKPIRKR
jgi:hypothetical protein